MRTTLRKAILLLSCIAMALPCLAQKTQIQFQQAGTNVYFGTGYFKFNFSSGFTVTNVGGVLTVTTAGGGVPYPAGTGIVQVSGGAAWGSTLALSGTGNVAMTTNAVFTTPNLGTPSALVLTNATGAPTWNQNTTGTAANLTGCTPSAAGDLCYWNGSAWTRLAGNTTTTNWLQESSGGVPSWTTPSGAGPGSGTQYTSSFWATASTLGSSGTIVVPAGASSGTIQTILSAATAGQEIDFTGTYSACSLTLTVADVHLRGLSTDGAVIQCATAGVPVLTVSGAADEVIGLNLKHITNSPTCPGGAGTSTCGDGLQIAGGATRVKVEHVHTNFNYNGIALGYSTYGEFSNSVSEFNNNHGVVFVMDATHQNMQWQVSRVLSEQNLGNGFDMSCPAGFTSVQTPGPYITGWTAAYGNVGYGFNFSCSAATTSGIADVWIDSAFASANNASGFRFDLGPNGGRNLIASAIYSEQSGTYTGTAGFSSASQSATNVGYGVEITSSCDNTPAPILTGINVWGNSYSGIIASCPGTSTANVASYGNGAASASAQTEAGVTINATNVQVNGGYHRKGSTQTYGIYLLSGDTPAIVAPVCDSSISAANCVFSGTAPTNGYQQFIGQTLHITGSGVPSESAPEGSTYDRTDSPNGGKYTRTNGAWVLLGASGGTVTSFSAGNLSPLFTSSVATATSTPALTFSLSSAAQNSVFAGPASGGAGAPSFQTAPTISAANMTSFPTFNQSTTGNAATATAFASYTNYSVYASGAGVGVWKTPTANSQCFMSDSTSYGSVTPSFQTCPSAGSGLSGMTALGFPIPNSATTINSSTTPGTNQGTYLPQRVNTTQGTAATITEAQVGIGGRAITASTTDTTLYSDVNSVIDHDQGYASAVTETIDTPANLHNTSFGTIYWNQSSQTDTLKATTNTIQVNDAAPVAGSTGISVGPGQVAAIKQDPNLSTNWLVHVTDSAGFINGGAVPASAALVATNSNKQTTAVTVGTGVVTALGVNTGTAGAFVVNGGALGTPSSGTLTNATGLPESGVTNLTTDLAAKSPLASPTFTGTPAAPTPTAGDNSTTLATTAYANTVYNLIKSSGSPFTLLGLSGYYWNNSGAAYTFQLDAPVAGKQYCFGNYSAETHAITVKSTTSVYIVYKGANGTVTTGTLVSGGAAGDFTCMVGVDTTHYMVTGAGYGTWTNN